MGARGVKKVRRGIDEIHASVRGGEGGSFLPCRPSAMAGHKSMPRLDLRFPASVPYAKA
jgi:hypothetical protein